MGWQDAPVVGATSAQPAWAAAPVVQPQGAQQSKPTPRPMSFSERWDALMHGLNIALPVATPVMEAAGQLATGSVAAPVAGVAGLTTLPAGTGTAADNVEKVSSALTYQPRTQGGQMLSRIAGAPMELLAKGGDQAGDYVSQKTGSPLAGALTNTTVQALPMVLLRGRGNAAEVGADVTRTPPVGRPPARPEGTPPNQAPPAARPPRLDEVPPPSREELRTQRRDAYQRAEDAGVVIRGDAFERFQQNVDQMLQRDGVDPTLHPSTTAAARRIAQERGPITLERLETLRRIAKDAEGAQAPADRRLANRVVDQIDDFQENLADRDLHAGTPEAVDALQQARNLYSRERKAATLDELAERAQNAAGANYTQAGLETALRQQFRALANNPRRFRLFNAEERTAIQRVVRGAPVENALRLLGRLAPTSIVSGGVGAALGAAIGGTVGAVAVPAAGAVARHAATQMTLRNVRNANELVRRGPRNAGLNLGEIGRVQRPEQVPQ